MERTMTDAELQRVADFYGVSMEQARANHAKVMSQGDDPARPICIGCAKWPEEFASLVELGDEVGQTATEYVLENEGTLNHGNGHFLCDLCYIKNGCPVSDRGWKCP